MYDDVDAIAAAAAYLHDLGAREELDERAQEAARRYSGSGGYADAMLARAQGWLRAGVGAGPGEGGSRRLPPTDPWLAPAPGQAVGIRCDARIVLDVVALAARYDLRVTECHAASGHGVDGEHPRGLAIDAVPRAGGDCFPSWRLVTELARWAEPSAGSPRAPFRWVGYDGDSGHGCGHHLHLSWQHSGGPAGSQMAWVAKASAARRIVLAPGQEPNAEVSVLVHELGHALGVRYSSHGRERAEVIVETAAFIV